MRLVQMYMYSMRVDIASILSIISRPLSVPYLSQAYLQLSRSLRHYALSSG